MPIRPEQFSGDSPLAALAAAFKAFERWERYLPPFESWMREIPLAVRSHTIGLTHPFIKQAVYPICWAQRIMDEPGDKQANARRAIKVLEGSDWPATALCIGWLKVNHNV